MRVFLTEGKASRWKLPAKAHPKHARGMNTIRKIFRYLFILLFLAGLAYAGWFYWQNLRGAGPVISKPAANTDELLKNLKIESGFLISIFADNLVNPRVLIHDNSGNLFTSLTSEGKVVALPDKNADGKADDVKIVAEGLKNPHGLAFYCPPAGGKRCSLYIAEENQVAVYDYDETNFKALNKKKIIDLPAGGNHFTRTLLIAPSDEPGGKERILISMGSTCNVCNEENIARGKIMASDLDGKNLEVFAAGLRNSVFMTLHPITGQVWATEMGRDLLGDDLPPDEINIIQEGKNYGWPTCFGNNIHDTAFDKNTYVRNPCMEPFEMPSLIDIPAHSAPLGLGFIPESKAWPQKYWHNLFVAYHGSWNRTQPTGYKVVRYELDSSGDYEGNSPKTHDFITGWLQGEDKDSAIGRPAGILVLDNGLMYISDDKAGVIYLVKYTGGQ